MPCLDDGLQPRNPEERWCRVGFRLTSLEESTSPPNPREKKNNAAVKLLGKNLDVAALKTNNMNDFLKCAALLGVEFEEEIRTAPPPPKVLKELEQQALGKRQMKRLLEVSPAKVCFRLNLCVVCCSIVSCVLCRPLKKCCLRHRSSTRCTKLWASSL